MSETDMILLLLLFFIEELDLVSKELSEARFTPGDESLFKREVIDQ
jgi:hypothetical protein